MSGYENHPRDGGHRAHDGLDVDARRCDPQPLPLACKKHRVGRIAVERGREVQQREADVVHFAAVDLGDVRVGELVKQPDERQDEEELHDVEKWLRCQGVKFDCPAPDRAPVHEDDPESPGSEDQRGGHDRWRPDPADVLHGAVQEAVGVEDVEEEEERVEALGLFLGGALARGLRVREEFEVPFGRRLLDQAHLPEHLLVLADDGHFDPLARELCLVVGVDLSDRARAVEELAETPLRVVEVVVLRGLRVLDHPVDLPQLHDAPDHGVGADRRSVARRPVEGREGRRALFDAGRGEESARTRAHGSRGQILLQR